MADRNLLKGRQISDALVSLRQEIKDAKELAQDDLRFQIQELEVSFEVASAFDLVAQAELGGKVKFLIVDADLKGKIEASGKQLTTHSVSFKFRVTDESGEDFNLGA